ncbi:uncharacterized protein LOC143292399 isoform X1 [Babylonia areolata]|uniref:uncharacterized protein LOC143292399 isoform X1 n=1 Tax=Babylonia areolata TaxID=304850 RepID=UPI003FD081FD
MGAIVKAVAAVLLAICVRRVLRIYNICGGFANYHQHHPGPCKQVEGIQLGSEDFHTLSDGQTFISSGLRYMAMTPQTREYLSQNGVRGRMYLLDLRDPSAGVRELEIITSGLFSTYTFVPHGISVWEDEVTGRHVLFVVNHRYQEGPIDSRVEKFIYDADRQALVHVATFSDPSMMVVLEYLLQPPREVYHYLFLSQGDVSFLRSRELVSVADTVLRVSWELLAHGARLRPSFSSSLEWKLSRMDWMSLTDEHLQKRFLHLALFLGLFTRLDPVWISRSGVRPNLVGTASYLKSIKSQVCVHPSPAHTDIIRRSQLSSVSSSSLSDHSRPWYIPLALSSSGIRSACSSQSVFSVSSGSVAELRPWCRIPRVYYPSRMTNSSSLSHSYT